MYIYIFTYLLKYKTIKSNEPKVHLAEECNHVLSKAREEVLNLVHHQEKCKFKLQQDTP